MFILIVKIDKSRKTTVFNVLSSLKILYLSCNCFHKENNRELITEVLLFVLHLKEHFLYNESGTFCSDRYGDWVTSTTKQLNTPQHASIELTGQSTLKDITRTHSP